MYMKKIISFASDFGLDDGSVGVVKGVINRVDPDLKINDISHGIPPQSIKYGSLLLMRAIQYIPQGVCAEPGTLTQPQTCDSSMCGSPGVNEECQRTPGHQDG